MAVVTTKSTTLTNLEASPSVVADVRSHHGRLYIKSEYVSIAAGDDDGSVYRFFRVRSSDSIKRLTIFNPAITGGTNFDLGLYTINGGAVVDKDLYAEGISLATAAPAVPPTADGGSGIECRFGVAGAAHAEVNNKVWQDLGLTADPNLEYDICLTGDTVGSGAGDVALHMIYTSGS